MASYKRGPTRSTDLTMKGTAGRDCSPSSHQRRALMRLSEPQKNVDQTDYGTPMGGVPAEAKGTGHGAGGVIDPATFNLDLHSVRMFSRYSEGKRSGPDWLHQRVEAADAQRWQDAAQPLLRQSLPKRTKY